MYTAHPSFPRRRSAHETIHADDAPAPAPCAKTTRRDDALAGGLLAVRMFACVGGDEGAVAARGLFASSGLVGAMASRFRLLERVSRRAMGGCG